MEEPIKTRLSLAGVKILKVLLGSRKRLWGMEIIEATMIPSGTLYPILKRFENLGIVTSEWEKIDTVKAGRPARRYYRLTPAGRKYAKQSLAKLQLK